MGIETAALAAAAGEMSAVAAPAVLGAAATTAGLGAAATGAAGAAGAALGTEAAIGAGTAIAPGSLEFANAVGAIGGDSLGAFISANGGFGTMTGAQSLMGAASAIGDSPIISALGKGMDAASSGQSKQAALPAPNTGPGATARPNQNPGLTQQSALMQPTQKSAGADPLAAVGFADGGEVGTAMLKQLFPDNIFERTRAKREQDAGLDGQGQGGGVTINVNAGAQQPQQPQQPVNRTEATTQSLKDFAAQVLNLIQGNANGGQVRTGSSDVKAGGEIRGPQSKDGKDNQLIKVAGGEGILPVDVMDVPGVPELVQHLIQTFHTPVAKS